MSGLLRLLEAYPVVAWPALAFGVFGALLVAWSLMTRSGGGDW